MAERDLPVLAGYRFKKFLGGGSFGKVYLADDLNNGRLVAVKRINKRHAYLADTEIEAMRRVNHENIIKLYDHISDDNYYYLIMEFAQCGDIFDYIARGMREDVARLYFRQLVSALEHLHTHNICHRDLKLENILLDGNYTLKICDFGISHEITGTLLKTLCGTPTYLAPEVFTGCGYDGMKADIWAAGVLLCVFLAAELPIEDRAVDSDPLYMKLKRGIYDYDPWVTTLIGLPADLCKRMLDPNPATRADWNQVKEHPWYSGLGTLVSPIMDLLPYMTLQREISIEDSNAASQNSSDIAVYGVVQAVACADATEEVPAYQEPTLTNPTAIVLPAKETLEDILERLRYALASERNCVVKDMHTPRRLKVKVLNGVSTHRLSFLVAFYRHRKGNLVVEFTRSKGDIATFRRLFYEIRPSLE